MSHHVDPMKKRVRPAIARCQATGKIIYKRAQDAMKVVGGTRGRKRDLAQWPRSAYQCEHCRRWHVTSFSAEETRRMQKAKKRQRAGGRLS